MPRLKSARIYVHLIRAAVDLFGNRKLLLELAVVLRRKLHLTNSDQQHAEG
jgi:hypothetical protein